MDMKTSPLALLNDPTLLKTDGLINGQWVVGISRFDVNDPATGLKLADVANLGPADAEAAIAAANAAWGPWRTKTAKERSIILRKWYDLLMANQDDLGRIMTAEQGKPLAAGCPVVIKPAELTPLTALAAAELALRAGIPAGVFNILPADSDNSIAIGKVLCASDVVRHISFTGSTEVGRILMAQSAPTSLAH